MNINELDHKQIVKNALITAEKFLGNRPADAFIILKQLDKTIGTMTTSYEKLDDEMGKVQYDCWKLLTIAYQALGKYDESLEIISKCLAVTETDPDIYNNMSIAYANQDRFDLSIQCLNKAKSLNPSNHVYISNLALHYRQIGQTDRAIDLLEEALAIKAEPQIWCHLGGVYGERKDFVNAERCFKKSLEMEPNFPPAHVDLAFTYHLTGQWQKGFEEYEWRFKHFSLLDFYKAAYDQTKKWTGTEDISGKKMLIYGEQGLGDIIQFVRYVPFLKNQGAYVMVHVPKELASVIARCPGVDEVVVCDIIVQKQPLPTYDYHCSLMSLPHLLGLKDIPFSPYIKATGTFGVRDRYPKTFNIGVSWAGSAAHPQDQVRSFHLKLFEGIAKLEGVKLFNLQFCPSERVYGAGKVHINFAEGGEVVPMVDMAPLVKTFDDTASIINELDLIISADTALIHLAGAMDIPCWVLLPFNPDWRWQSDGPTTDWYDSVKLFRQHRLRDWSVPFTQMKGELENILQNKR